jgi:hypothetical protein
MKDQKIKKIYFYLFFETRILRPKKNFCVGRRSCSRKKYLRLCNTLCVVRLEAVSVERNLALLAHVDRLQVSLPLEMAHLAVAPLSLAGGVLLRAHNSVAAQVVKPCLPIIANKGPPPDGLCAVLRQHADAQLAQEVQVWFFVTSLAHPQPPGVDRTNT